MKPFLGWAEKILGALVLVYAVLWFLPGFDTGKLILKLAIALLFVRAVIRAARVFVEQAIWRLRNRLIVAYFFIAVVPVVLISALIWLGGYLLVGQMALHIATSELERQAAFLRESSGVLARTPPQDRREWARTVAPSLGARFPDLRIIVGEPAGPWVWPPGSEPAHPAFRPDTDGLVLRGGLLYVWAHVARGDRRVTSSFPITRDYLGALAPNLGESAILNLRGAKTRATVRPARPEAELRPSTNRMPPAVNRFDHEVVWLAALPVAVWDNSNLTEYRYFTIRTRPSAVMRTVFAQNVEIGAEQIVPVLFFGVAILFLVAEVIALAIGVSLTRTITGAVHYLYEGTLKVRGGDFSHRVPVTGRDQLAELTRSFNQMTGHVEHLLQIAKAGERLQAELEIAREVQNQLYPRATPEFKAISLTAVCEPARTVSGDYYDFQTLPGGELAIAVGDVAGKGISAALLMATVQSSFRTQLRNSLVVPAIPGGGGARPDFSPAGLVTELNRHLHSSTTPEKFATFFLGVYDEPAGVLTYTNAGHLPPILVQRGRASRLEVNGLVVGAFSFAEYDESRVRMQPGDLLVLFTDGVTEPENEYGEMFGEDRLTDMVTRNAHLPNEQIVSLVLRAVHEWTGSDELQDDITLMLVRRRSEVAHG